MNNSSKYFKDTMKRAFIGIMIFIVIVMIMIIIVPDEFRLAVSTIAIFSFVCILMGYVIKKGSSMREVIKDEIIGKYTKELRAYKEDKLPFKIVEEIEAFGTMPKQYVIEFNINGKNHREILSSGFVKYNKNNELYIELMRENGEVKHFNVYIDKKLINANCK
ncbi:hypothetical protein NL50_16370 [Clostridium acetobutylicum]|nr:hypothetical protein NL50_16370 [Clostridium acetobutylicum]